MATELGFQPNGTQVNTKSGLERIADIDPRLTRSYYFDSRLLTAEDLNRDQIYLDGRLREVGQALGYGIVKGFETSLGELDGIITVKPGIAVTRAGRVLELTRELHLDLGDRALISELNDGSYRHLDRSLYAVVVTYAETGTDIAEVFPTDLGSNRTFKYDVMSEGVQLSLVRIPQALAQQSAVIIRANLLREWAGDNTAGGAVPEDGVGLGVLAISNDRPQWLDAELLRQPLRFANNPGDLQKDLARRYENVLKDLLLERSRSSLDNDFAADNYFSVLPPVGTVPKDSINPVTGRQGYFPENFNVWVAPVRLSDLDLVRSESITLPAIDLNAREPIDVIVLVPLTNVLYGKYAQQLELPAGETRLIPSQDLLRLRLYPRQVIDTDVAAWTDIVSKTTSENFIYIRRPLRAAETRLSAISLAKGVVLPPDQDDPEQPLPSPSDHGLLESEDSAFLNLLNLEKLVTLRPPVNEDGEVAVRSLKAGDSAKDATVVQNLASALVHTDRVYDPVVWQTARNFIEKQALGKFVALLLAPENLKTPVADLVEKLGSETGLDKSIIEAWKKLGQPVETPAPTNPEPTQPIPTEPSPTETVANAITLKQLVEWRPQPTDESTKAAKAIIKQYSKNADITQLMVTALVRIERTYDSVVWQTLSLLADNKNLPKFVDLLVSKDASDAKTGALVEKFGGDLGLDEKLVKAWVEIAGA